MNHVCASTAKANLRRARGDPVEIHDMDNACRIQLLPRLDLLRVRRQVAVEQLERLPAVCVIVSTATAYSSYPPISR